MIKFSFSCIPSSVHALDDGLRFYVGCIILCSVCCLPGRIHDFVLQISILLNDETLTILGVVGTFAILTI
jgi:hypothetical protein